MPLRRMLHRTVSWSSCDHLQDACTGMAGGHACQTLQRCDRCVEGLVLLCTDGNVLHAHIMHGEQSCTSRRSNAAALRVSILSGSHFARMTDCGSRFELPGQKGAGGEARAAWEAEGYRSTVA